MTFEATVQALTGDDASAMDDSMADMHHDDVEMAPADETDEAELLATLRDRDQAFADRDLDRATALATTAHEAAHHLEAHT